MIRDKRTEKFTICIGANLLFSISFINFIIFHRLTTTNMQILQHIMTHRDICIYSNSHVNLRWPLLLPGPRPVSSHIAYDVSVQCSDHYLFHYLLEIDLFRRCNLSSFHTLHPFISFSIGQSWVNSSDIIFN